ncbi:MAG: class I SAM-dependent methyltransferase [Vicinamibacterales bacterium]|nr:class I SAM-dependent methyltransferase [Vicinamibacterales bacterium]
MRRALRIPSRPYMHYFLEPVENPITSAYVPLFGWLVADRPPRSITVNVFGTPAPYELHPKADIAAAHPGKYTTGIYSILEISHFAPQIERAANTLDLDICMDGVTFVRQTIAVAGSAMALAATGQAHKHRKRDFMLHHAQCPACSQPLPASGFMTQLRDPHPSQPPGAGHEPLSSELLPRSIVCPTCQTAYPQGTGALNLIADPTFAIHRALPTSLCRYSDLETRVIEEARTRGGYVLDFGAGLRDVNADNVINLEIADYPTTDVLSNADSLPFLPESFDAVISLHVMEHVPRPWLIASEMQRILKPGGVVLCTVPFVSMEHGFPDHYYNMTRSGLKNLFAGMTLVDHVVKEDGHPINSVQQVLSTYSGSLAEPYRSAFGALRVKDIVHANLPDLLLRDFATNLPDRARWTMAAHTTVLMRK